MVSLGIDLGTSGVKLVLLDAAQQLLAEASAALQVQRPHPLWSEQHPADWWHATEQAVSQLRAAAPAAWQAVHAIGLSGQMHGAVLLDASQQVLRPAILWNDGRAFAECDALEAAEPRTRAITGNAAMPGFTAPKLLWVRQHEPQVFEKLDHVLLPKDWLRLQLTGDAVSEMSDASGTLWLDVGARRWSDAMLAACSLDTAHMPRLVEGNAPSGTLRPALARAWGLRDGVVVAGGAGDNAASAVGMGAVRAGQGLVSLGTSGVVFLAGDAFAPRPERAVHAFAHALPGRWHQMSVMLSAASALTWAARLTGQPDEAALVRLAGTLTPAQCADAPLFLPYLSGERTPHNDAHASGVLMGLRAGHGAAEVGYAVLEGVGFGLRDGLLAMQPDGVDRHTALALVGGGARSDLWSQLLASILGCTLVRHADAQSAAAVGAARLGLLAAGVDEATACAAPDGGVRCEPDTGLQPLLAARHERFGRLYPALHDAFKETA